MRKLLAVAVLVTLCPCVCLAQASGSVGYSQSGGRSRAAQNERNKRSLPKDEQPPNDTSMFVEASVLMNVKADEHVAVFAIMHECATVPECGQKMDATAKGFINDLAQLGIGPADVFVDFASQNKIYGFRLEGNVAKERLVGFELKKNVSVHYKDRDLLDRVVVAAARQQIFDLVKVDYVVRDPAAVHARMMEEAAKVLEEKAARYARLLGVKFRGPGQVYAERPSVYYPTEMYDSFAAFEAEDLEDDDYGKNDRVTVHRARKSRTFFFNPLNSDGFDRVFNPVVIEPVVQFTLYLKVRYDLDRPQSK